MKNYTILYLVLILMISIDGFAQKEDAMSLNGTWNIIFDDQNMGRESDWMISKVFDQHKDKQQIQVPSCWEEMNEDYEGVAFYQRKFHIPQDWNQKLVHLKFDAVNYVAEVYLNDHVLGSHEGGFTPFEFNVEHLLNFGGENVLVLRVIGPVTMTDKIIDGMGKMETPQWRGAYTGGIWQSVSLTTTGKTFIKNVFVQSDIHDSSTKVQLQIENSLMQHEDIEVEMFIVSKENSNDRLVQLKKRFKLLPGMNRIEEIMKLTNPVYWSPDHPHLYALKTIIRRNGLIEDVKEVNFGMREFTIKNNQFYLNNQPFYLKATFFEGLYPVKLAYPDSKEMAIREIQLAKEAGFNMIRPWRKPPPPIWLNLADSLGVLTVGSLAVECMGKPEQSPYLPARVERELKESILRDRNRASIVQWELFNELHRPVLINMLKPMSILARELDPTRMILDESGGWAEGANLYLPYQRIPTKFNDIHHYPGPNVNSYKFDSFLAIGNTKEENEDKGIYAKPPGRNVLPGLLSYTSELGYGSLPDLEMNAKSFEERGNPITPPYKYHKRIHKEIKTALRETGIDRMFSNTSEFYLEQQRVHGLANQRMIEGVRSNPNIGGYCIHALTAGDWIIGAGLLDLWRNPKVQAYNKTRDANQKQLTVIRITPRNIYADQGAELELIAINELEDLSAKISIQIIDPEDNVVYQQAFDMEFSKGITTMFKQQLNTEKMEGAYQFIVQVKDMAGQEITSASRTFFVFNKKESLVKNKKIALIGKHDNLYKYLISKSYDIEIFSNNTKYSTPVIIGKKNIADKNYLKEIKGINEFVEKGGQAIFLEVPGKEIKRTGPQRSFEAHGEKLLPSNPILKQSMGLWDAILHMVHKHPIFEGLPVHEPMISIYENIAPTQSMEYQNGDMAVNTVAFDRFPNADDYRRNYVGPGKVWWASDVVIVPHEKGRMLLSTLKLLSNLGKDPVADKLLFNMIKVMSENVEYEGVNSSDKTVKRN